MTPNVSATREAWRKYVSAGALDQRALRPAVFSAWERCHDLGASPRQARAESLSPDATARLLDDQAELLSAARPYLTALSRAAGQERHAAMLGDARGVVLDVIGDQLTVHGPEPFPGPGSLLAEQVSGANGIGTPLAAAEYVELVGPEHFIGGFHVFTCQGAPVRAPDGSVAGIISTSVRKVEASSRLREILVCAAHGMEAELLKDRIERDVRRVVTTGGAAALQNLRDDLMQSYASGRARLEAAARRFADRALGATSQLLQEAQRAIDRFRAQAALWRDLSLGDVGVVQPIALDQLTTRIAELLETEARVRRTALHAGALEPVVATDDARSVERAIFTGFMDALDSAGPGGAVLFATRPLAQGGGTVRIWCDPAVGGGRPPLDRVLTFGARR